MREAPNLEHTVRGIHTIGGGSHPLLVSYVLCASTSYSSWWSIIDHLLYQHKVLGIGTKITNVVFPSTQHTCSYYWYIYIYIFF